ncbi:N-acetylglutaminylglutamine synthetase [Pseudomarimonas arenosa]|uniref:N-acetylglutaminylglutamine synthetase n=1 Tax=Pseudomarimonas arenosa TaxID=2774145 RepID=A0AAW3ZNU9_9GAMM|nr:N-acetylglutaminylglutamine synthetase [Pseudomarimonas arenosa]MBD8527408.1 N-acetylglutaminylglutamine synthetase [Pseudomarimonas arenosa]
MVDTHGAETSTAIRLRRLRGQALKPPIYYGEHAELQGDVILDCGWGRLLFGQTFEKAEPLIEAIRAEAADTRDIAFYIRNPHVVLAVAPQELFLDPSHTYRLDLTTYAPDHGQLRSFSVRRLASSSDAEGMRLIYAQRGMVPIPREFLADSARHAALTYLVAVEHGTGKVIGTVTGVDHQRVFDDPERGSSLWCLAVDPNAASPGVGEALVRRLAEHLQARGAAYMDLSVMHDNEQAIALYDKLGFFRVPFFALKRKNTINEPLFIGPRDDAQLNPYARIIVDEARRRGVHVEVTDAASGMFRLTHGGRSIHCRESLSELTTAVAMSICDDKSLTRRVVSNANISVPEQIDATGDLDAFLKQHGAVVVKPARGEQGNGVAVGLQTREAVDRALQEARRYCDQVLIERCVEGEDLRLVVIDYKVVAAATRRPPQILGDGHTSVRELIERQSRRRQAATGGESSIPIDSETERCIAEAGYTLDDVPPKGALFAVRKAVNLHTGGTIHDVTDEVHPELVNAAVAAARAINIPVVGIDFMVRSVSQPDYVFIEANERVGLANHEPHPTAERFVDLLFPLSIPAPQRSG